jgi:hypothetical protein
MKNETYVAIDDWLERRLGLVLLIALLILASGPLLFLGQWITLKVYGFWPDISMMSLYRPITISGRRSQRIVDWIMRQQIATWLFVASSAFVFLSFIVLKMLGSRVTAAKRAVYYAKRERGDKNGGL